MESFKIGDARRPQVSGTPKKKAANGKEAAAGHSLGFERIEKFLEAEDTEAQLKALEESMEALKKLAAEAVSPREKSAAEKALKAYTNTMDLVQFLLKTKEQMMASK